MRFAMDRARRNRRRSHFHPNSSLLNIHNSDDVCVSPLSKKATESFKDLYLRKYGVLLTDQQAQDIGGRLMSFLRRIEYPFDRKKL